MKKYNITEFAKLCCVTPRTLKYYEEIGLFHPASIREKGHREYTVSQMDEVSAIVLFAQHGMKLKDIKAMFEQGSLFDVCQRMKKQKEIIEDKIAALTQQQKHLEIMLWHMEKAAEQNNTPFLVNDFERSIRIEALTEAHKKGAIINYLSLGFLNGTILRKDSEGFRLDKLYFQDEKQGSACHGPAAFLYTKKPPSESIEDLEKLQKFAKANELKETEIFCEQIVESSGAMERLFLYFCLKE